MRANKRAPLPIWILTQAQETVIILAAPAIQKSQCLASRSVSRNGTVDPRQQKVPF